MYVSAKIFSHGLKILQTLPTSREDSRLAGTVGQMANYNLKNDIQVNISQIS